MNSVRSLGRAIEYEIARQVEMVESGGRVVQETRHWDEAAGVTHGMRSKEGSEDYRYFPEPDLVPVAPTAAMRDAARAAVGELPAARRARFVDEWGVSETDARTLLESPGLADYAEAAVAAGAPGKDVTNWLTGEVLGYLNETGLSPAVLPFPPDALAELIGLVGDGTLSRGLAKDVLARGTARRRSAHGGRARPRPRAGERRRRARGRGRRDPRGQRRTRSRSTAAATTRLRKKKRGFLMGELMKATKGSANPQVLNRLLDEALT